ncbi:hypothetical protein CSUI_002811 [Cystoisospora suis]|uniref:Uncharacterized protein n=1 Tax=Cystoisospora suis TaxID=483139 RepID=A0A2C6KSM0_9APIC|nr:hypothetical protein CSUI_002811 [Cystoisospora suis]
MFTSRPYFLSTELNFSHVLSLPLHQEQRSSLHRHDTLERDRTTGVSVSSSRDRDRETMEMNRRPSSEKREGHEDASVTTSVRKEERDKRTNYGPSGDSQEPSLEDQVVHKLVQQGSSDSAKIKIEGLRKFTEAKENLSRLRQDAAKKCREGKKEMCETPEKPLAKTLHVTLPELPPVIKPFILQRNEGHSEKEDVSSSKAESHIHPTAHESASNTDGASEKERHFSSSAVGTFSPSPSSVSSTRQGTNRSRKKGIDNRQLAILSSIVDLEEGKVFMELQSKGFFDMLNNMFLGGTGDKNPANFEGGNQGSFFNFMYPQATDYPWACVCDENTYKKYEAGEIQSVPCRNEVDMSAQGVVALCNPRNHKMNDGTPSAAFSSSFLLISSLLIVYINGEGFLSLL